jgi:hypothetical protein
MSQWMYTGTLRRECQKNNIENGATGQVRFRDRRSNSRQRSWVSCQREAPKKDAPYQTKQTKAISPLEMDVSETKKKCIYEPWNPR